MIVNDQLFGVARLSYGPDGRTFYYKGVHCGRCLKLFRPGYSYELLSQHELGTCEERKSDPFFGPSRVKRKTGEA